jgi:hypothetical protein
MIIWKELISRKEDFDCDIYRQEVTMLKTHLYRKETNCYPQWTIDFPISLSQLCARSKPLECVW